MHTSPKRQIILIAHNLRSCHNVGSLLRTTEGIGVNAVWLTGYTPFPAMSSGDPRLPHEAQRIHKQITKTSLGAENSVVWYASDDITEVIDSLNKDGFQVLALEQTAKSLPLPSLPVPSKVALIVGREVEGIEPEILALCDNSVEIPMLGSKESFNVVQAAAMALYHCRFANLANTA